MSLKDLVSVLLLSYYVTPAFADPTMSVVPQGIQAGNWVWDVNITPDYALAGGSTPVDVELGFRLSGDPLVSVTNINPLIFDFNTASNTIFGWEIPYGFPPLAEGIEANCTGCIVANPATLGGHASTVVPGTTNEIFVAMGSGDTSLPGAIPFLRIVAKGPGTGGPLSSTIEWLGSYNGKGRISQIVGTLGQSFDIPNGSLTQAIPEPACATLLAAGTILAAAGARSRRRMK